jgi:hypothetical protein
MDLFLRDISYEIRDTSSVPFNCGAAGYASTAFNRQIADFSELVDLLPHFSQAGSAILTHRLTLK